MPRVKSNLPDITIKVSVYGHDVAVNLSECAEDLLVDPNNLDEQMARQAVLYFDIAEYAACAIAEAERCKQDLEVWQSEKWRDLFNRAVERGEKPPTVDSAKAEVKADPKYATLHSRYIDAQEDASLLENARDAMKMRQFMLAKLAGAASAEGN